MVQATPDGARPAGPDYGVVKAVVKLRTFVDWAVGLLWALLGLAAFIFLASLVGGTLTIDFGGIIMLALVGVVVGALAAARRAIEALAVAAGAELPVGQSPGVPATWTTATDAPPLTPSQPGARAKDTASQSVPPTPSHPHGWSPVSRARRVSLGRRT